MAHKFQPLRNLPCSALSANQSIQETLHCQSDAELTENIALTGLPATEKSPAPSWSSKKTPWVACQKTIHNLRGLQLALVEF